MPLLHTSQTNNIYIPGLGRAEDDLAAFAPGRRDRYVRGFTDEEVAQLPDLPESHGQSRIWRHRKASSRRLVEYLAFKNKALSILEVGCGNGWLSFQLSSIPGNKVLGLDRDLGVLQQAARVFRHQPNLKFMCGDFYSDIMTGLTFDTIVFAASIQCFPSMRDILGASMLRLKEGGEIHILDTPVPARELRIFRHRYMFNPRSLCNRLMGRGEQLPWIRVTNYQLNR
jgi:ubiquinone/menaquinone biosynthesis C-methylase UbiE